MNQKVERSIQAPGPGARVWLSDRDAERGLHCFPVLLTVCAASPGMAATAKWLGCCLTTDSPPFRIQTSCCSIQFAALLQACLVVGVVSVFW